MIERDKLYTISSSTYFPNVNNAKHTYIQIYLPIWSLCIHRHFQDSTHEQPHPIIGPCHSDSCPGYGSQLYRYEPVALEILPVLLLWELVGAIKNCVGPRG